MATPKKRFYGAMNIFKFIRPGFTRISVKGSECKVRLLAFVSDNGDDVSFIGINTSSDACRVHIATEDLPGFINKPLHYYLTNETDNCTKQPDIAIYDTVQGIKRPNDHFEAVIPPRSIFTFTTL